jgi:protein-tyrosine phosphatase
MSSSNARDLGGLRTDDGHAIRPGMILRTDDTFWNEGRLSEQRARRGVPAFVRTATVRMEESLVDEATAINTDEDMARFYLGLFTGRRGQIGAIMRRLATDTPSPAIVFCVAGKDRTGVTCALLEYLLGVRREEIVGDYARSAAFMATVLASGQIDDEGRGEEELVLPGHSAHARTMERFLDEVEAECVGAEALASALGLEPHHLVSLRDRLLIPVAETEALAVS